MPSSIPPAGVVTGLGAVMPIGDFPSYWANLVAGITEPADPSFDPSGYEVQIAAEVLDFDPTRRWT